MELPSEIVSANHCNICSIKHTDMSNVDGNLITTLKTCSGCKLISYCSIEHQKLDWNKHMELCRAVQTILISKPIDCGDPKFVKAQYLHEFTSGPIKNYDQLLEASWKMQLILEKLLKRGLHNYERELISFPRICPNCLNFNVNPKYKCRECNEVTYCCKTCLVLNEKSHIKVCNDLKIYYNFYDIKEINLKFLYNYNNINMENTHLLEYLQNFTKIKIPTAPKTLQEYQIFSTACNYSYVCTLLKIIRQCNNRCNDIANSDNFLFTIYFVGAKDELKYFKAHHCKFLLSQLPTIKKLKLAFIGPDLKIPSDVKKSYVFHFEKVKFNEKTVGITDAVIGNEEITDCDAFLSPNNNISKNCQNSPSTQIERSCKSNDSENSSANTSDTESQDEIQLPLFETREVQFELSKTHFEDFVDGIDLDLNFIANLVICFNCQFNEFDGSQNIWKNAIKTFLQMKRTPIIFTSRTKLESKLDMKCVFHCSENEFQKPKLFIILKSNELNTMRDLRPYRNHEYCIDDETYHQNGYVSAVLGKSDEFDYNVNMYFVQNSCAQTDF